MLAKYRIKYNLTLRASHLTRWRFIAQKALTFGAKPKMWHMPSLGYQSSTAGAFQTILHRTVEEKPFYILCIYRYFINIYLPSVKHFKIHFHLLVLQFVKSNVDAAPPPDSPLHEESWPEKTTERPRSKR